MSRILILLTLLVLSSFAQSANELIECTITIENIKGSEGKLVIAVFDNEEDYLEKDVLNKEIKVTGNATEVVKLMLPAGEYAVAVFHDLNNNHELDKNLIGWPQEAFGFSNKSMGMFGPPTYNESKFTIPSTSEIKVKLKHL